MERTEAKKWPLALIIAAVVGGGMLVFVGLIVLPAILFLSAEDSSPYSSGPVYGPAYGADSSKVSIPKADASDAVDFFEDLDSK